MFSLLFCHPILEGEVTEYNGDIRFVRRSFLVYVIRSSCLWWTMQFIQLLHVQTTQSFLTWIYFPCFFYYFFYRENTSMGAQLTAEVLMGWGLRFAKFKNSESVLLKGSFAFFTHKKGGKPGIYKVDRWTSMWSFWWLKNIVKYSEMFRLVWTFNHKSHQTEIYNKDLLETTTKPSASKNKRKENIATCLSRLEARIFQAIVILLARKVRKWGKCNNEN